MKTTAQTIPAWQLYGETRAFPDICHVERIADRATGLGWTIAPHRHMHLHQIFLVQSGHVVLSTDGIDRQVAPPFVLNVPPGVVHGFRFSAGTEGFVLTLPVAEFDVLLGPASETGAAAARAFTAAADDSLGRLFAALADTHRGAGKRRRTLLVAQVALILCAALDGAPAAAVAPPQDPRVQAFLSRIAPRLRDGWGVDDHARASGTSARHLGRLCHADLGQSPQALIEAERIREACRLLVYTRMSVSQVGFALGWADPSHFSRGFRRALGLSPRAYRTRFDRPDLEQSAKADTGRATAAP